LILILQQLYIMCRTAHYKRSPAGSLFLSWSLIANSQVLLRVPAVVDGVVYIRRHLAPWTTNHFVL